MSNNSFSVRTKVQSNGSNFPKVDYEAINAQVKTGNKAARISQIWDLGDHLESKKLGGKGTTKFQTAEEAEDFIEYVENTYKGSQVLKEKAIEVKEIDGEFVVNVNEYGGKDKHGNPKYVQEVAVVVDFTNMEVDYGEEIGKKPYREYLNSTFWNDGSPEMRGFVLKASPPKVDGGLWTLGSTSKLAKIAVATEHEEILNDKQYLMDISRFLGEPLNVQVSKNDGGFIRLGDVSGLVDGQVVPELPTPPVAIGFDGVTVEDLIAANPRYALLCKLKAANNYPDSDMQKAVEGYEAYLKEKNGNSDSDNGATQTNNEDKQEEDTSKKKTSYHTKDKVVATGMKKEIEW